jgi:hypothetical protein
MWVATAKALRRLAEQARELTEALPEPLSQIAIRRMAQRTRGALRSAWSRVPALCEHLLPSESPPSSTPPLLGEIALSRSDRREDSFSLPSGMGRGEGTDPQGPLHAEADILGRPLAAQPGSESCEAILVAVDPGHRDLLGLPFRGKQNHSRPVSRPLAEAGLDGVGHDVDEAVDQGIVIEYGFGRVAAFETRTAALPDAVDGSGEVAEEEARPGGELSVFISHDEVEVIGHDAAGENSQAGEVLLGASEPFQNGFVEFAVGPEKEARLMAACGDQVELTGFVASQRASHRRG